MASFSENFGLIPLFLIYFELVKAIGHMRGMEDDFLTIRDGNDTLRVDGR
jgi:hypothetical protein